MIVYYTGNFGGAAGESHRLLKMAITEYTGDKEKAEAMVDGMKTGEHGKPYIDAFCSFSISHSNDVWAVLFSEKNCGLDIQFERKCDILAIARRWFAGEDAEEVACAKAEDAGMAKDVFFRIWTRREALVKALGAAVYDSGLPPVSGDSIKVGDYAYALRDVAIPGIPGLHAAVCTEGNEDVSISFLALHI